MHKKLKYIKILLSEAMRRFHSRREQVVKQMHLSVRVITRFKREYSQIKEGGSESSIWKIHTTVGFSIHYRHSLENERLFLA